MQYSEESKKRMQEAWDTLQAALKRKAEKTAAEKAREEFYKEQLAKMPDYNPGSRKHKGAIRQRLESQ